MNPNADLFGYISIPKDEIAKAGGVMGFVRAQGQLPLNMSADEPYMFRPDMDLVEREIYEVHYHLVDDSKLIKTEVSSGEAVKFVFYKEGNWDEIVRMDTMMPDGWGFKTVTRWLNKPNRYIKGISKIGG